MQGVCKLSLYMFLDQNVFTFTLQKLQKEREKKYSGMYIYEIFLKSQFKVILSRCYQASDFYIH